MLLRWWMGGFCLQKASPASLLSPVPSKRAAEEKRRHTALPAAKAPLNKPAGEKNAAFRPSVLSTRRLNVRWVVFLLGITGIFTIEDMVALVCRFSEAPRVNENERSAVKTPARTSSCVASSTPLRQPADAGKRNSVKTAVFSATTTPGAFLLLRSWYKPCGIY